MVQVNNEWFYEDLTPENTKELLDKMVAGTEEPGPQIEERFNSEGP
jgi:NADH dehydrogenase (ubiquinone) flavoprotein 2